MAQYHLSAKIRKAANQNTAEKNYWLKKLSGEPVKSTFPSDCSHTGETHQEQVIFQIAGDIFSALRQRCRDNLYNLHIYMSAAVMALLSRYNVQEDIIIGTPIYRQDNIALFINKALPLRSRVAAGMTFKELLIHVKDVIAEAVKNQNYPVEMMVEQLNLSSMQDDFPLFDVSVCVEGIHDLTYLENIPQQIVFLFKMRPQSLEVQVYYNADRYNRETIERMIGHFKQWLGGALGNLDGNITGIEILTGTETERMVYELNDTDAGYPTEKTLPAIFAEQVEKTPDHIAVFGHGQTRTNTDKNNVETLRAPSLHVTYSYLNRQTNHLAQSLIEKGVLPDSIVGIMMERSIEMIIGMMGILKSGGAYLPIDPDYPQERIDYMLKDSKAKLTINYEFLKEAPQAPLHHSSFITHHSNQLVYVIYTSGTTGKPKGVLIEHRHVVRLLFNDRFQFDFNHRDVWTLFHSYCFDFSVWEMYGALLYGGKLIIIPFMTARDPQAFLTVLQKEQVTVLNQTPSAFYRLMREEDKEQKRQLCLKYVIFGGEALAPGQLRTWWAKYPDTALINMYGITETTVHVTFKKISIEEIEANISNIGKPIPTLSCYAMDPGSKLLPTGAAGELCVGGAGVGRGYLNRPELSAEKFVPNPYKKGEKLYRSGDQVRFTANGEMEYRGRIDHQVKIRGFRIEPGEIEKELLAHKGIKEAAVIDRLTGGSENNDRYLCAYFAPFPGFRDTLTAESLREFLLIKLPDYMIPAYFVELETIPLTPNGKIDRKALPLPHPVSGSGYKAPQGKIATALADTWQQVLQVEKISADANFFTVGGDSIKAIKLIGAINTSLGAQLKIIDIYSYQTIETMAQYLAEQLQKQTPSIGDIYIEEAQQEIEQFREYIKTRGVIPNEFTVEGIYPMSDIEKGIVFHSLKGAEEGLYHDQITVQQSYRDFNPGLLKKAIYLLVQKHPILRTAYIMEESAHIIYKYHESLMNVVVYEDISSQSPAEQETTIKDYIIVSRQRGFNLSQPPLWRFGIFKISGEIFIIVWEFHHAIFDGWSNASFLTELNNTYFQLVQDPNFIPVPLKASYRQFIVRQLAEKRDPGVKDYWLEKLTDYKRFKSPGTTSGDHIFKDITFNIGRQVREQLEAVAEKYHTGLKHLCFAAFLYMLNMFSYEPDITTGLVTHNRPETEDGEKILGCFLNTLPFRLKIPHAITWSDYIQLVDQEMVRLKKYEKLSLLEIVKIVEEPVETGNPFFDVLFNLVDFFVYGDLAKSGSELTEKDKLDLASFARTNFLIEVNIVTFGQEFLFTIYFSTDFITGHDAGRLLTYFKQVLAKFIHQPDSITAKSEILPEEEKRQLLYHLNDTKIVYPANQSIDRLFLSQAENTPDRVALLGPSIHIRPWDEGRVLTVTYSQLNRCADELAYLLREKGVYPRMIVAILVGRSVEMIMGTLAILKAGGAYLPIETDYPQDRIDYMLKDSGAKLLVCTNNKEGEKVSCRDVARNVSTKFLPSYLPISRNLAYIIYTSGSTGKPKGVMVEHGSAVNILLYRKATYEINERVTTLLLVSYSFDTFFTDCFTPLISGARVVLLGQEGRKDPHVIKNAIGWNKVTHITCTPTLFQAVIESLNVNEAASLRVVTLGGDRLPLNLLDDIRKKNAAVEVVHEYGVTEAAVTSTLYHHQEQDRHIKIGQPVWNTIILILDARGELQPTGIAGEMLIGGVGVARGYLNNPELTTDRFKRNVISQWSFVNGKFQTDNIPLNYSFKSHQ
ncbi:MAG: amino acid adenylation domain-containing protein [Acidobacteria bacterium]|nr:amino acid adenylation domain-containing protein [Acidobacteriota bacterium]